MGGEDMPSRTSLTCGRIRFWVLVDTCFDGPRFPFRERFSRVVVEVDDDSILLLLGIEYNAVDG